MSAVFAMGLPFVALWLDKRFAAARFVGPVVLCYAFGIALGNVVRFDEAPAMRLCEVSVAVAIPLLLFGADLGAFRKLARVMLIGFFSACVAAMSAASAIGWTFRGSHDEWWKIAGMLVGVYVGGTANMNAIGLALEAKQETFVLVNAADTFVGALYLFFLLTVARRLLLSFMQPSTQMAVEAEDEQTPMTGAVSAVILALALLGASAGVAYLITAKVDATVLLVMLTTLALCASRFAHVRALVGGRRVADYLLLVFCVSIGSMARAEALASASGTVLSFVALVMVGSILLHVLLCTAFRVDADATILSSTATIFGPAFVLPVARANKQGALLGPAVTLAVMGLALGTYCGLLTAHVLRFVTSGA